MSRKADIVVLLIVLVVFIVALMLTLKSADGYVDGKECLEQPSVAYLCQGEANEAKGTTED